MSKPNAICGLLPLIVLFTWVADGCGERKHDGPARVDVTLQQMQFMPSDIHVHVGDTVVFVNQGIVMHDITEATAKAWTSGPIPVGGSFALVVGGDTDYYCSLHPTMTGKITVHP